MESDKYMSMDSSIDDLLNDALSKRRARSIVASSASLGGSRSVSTRRLIQISHALDVSWQRCLCTCVNLLEVVRPDGCVP
jgi:hypothetical protein